MTKRSTALPLGALTLLAAACLAAAGESRMPVLRPDLPPATRGPVRIAFTPDGKRALVTESDSGTLAVLDAAAGDLRRRIPTGGEQPEGVAPDSDHTALVTNAFSGSVARLDLDTGKRLALLPLRGEPAEVVLSGDRRRAFVSLAQMDEVAVLDLPGLILRSRVRVGRRPRAMALTPDGSTLLVANFQGGDVSLLDTSTLRETRRVPLHGVNLRGLQVTPDGRHAYVASQVPAETRVTWVAMDVWVNTLFRLDLRAGTAAPVAEGRLDFTGAPAPDPEGVMPLDGDHAAVVASGSDEVLLVRAPESAGDYFQPQVERRAAVGAHPRGIAASPDGKHLWVANELSSSISVLDRATLAPVREIRLPAAGKPDRRMEGRYLFSHAGLTAGGQFTCSSCHPGGGSDGLVWQFVHVPDSLPVRNTKALRGGVTQTSPFRWSGREQDIEVFIQDEITGLLYGPRQGHDNLHALWNFLDQFPLPPNPYRTAEGRLTPSEERGKALFNGKAGCASCHAGELAGGTGKKASIGTTPDGQELDVPHLAGVYDSSPYLHDGRAKTLEEIFARWDPLHEHGKAHLLTKEELADVLRYVRGL